MKKIIFTLCCVLSVVLTYAQSTTRISATTTVQNKNVMYNVPAGSFVNAGVYTDTTSPGAFNASGGVAFSGAGTTRVYNLNLNAGSSDMTAAMVSVYKTATLASGASLNAGSGNLNLRTDLPGHIDANLVNNGLLTGTVSGLVTFATATAGGCPSYASTLSMNVSGSSMRYQWQSSADDVSYASITGATNATYVASVSTTLYYRCALSTNNTAYAQNTPGKLLSAGVPPTVVGTGVAYCSGASGAISASGATTYTWAPATGLSATTGASVTSSGLTTNTTYTVTGTTGTCSASVPVTVSINPLPNAGTISSTATVCIAATTTSASSGSAGGTWSSVTTATGTINAGTGLFRGIAAGTTIVSYTVTNGCGTQAATKVYTVNASPVAGTISGASAICANGSTTLGTTGSGGVWSSTNSAVGSVSAGGVLTGIAAGTATISYTVTNDCGSASATKDVTINARPAMGAISNSGPVCVGNTLNFSGSATGGTGTLTYAWSGPNTFTATGATPSIAVTTALATGTYSLVVTDANGCTATGTNTTAAVVNARPNTTAVSSNSPVCAGSNLNLGNTTTGGTAPLVYAWSGPNTFTSTVSNPTISAVTAAAAGTYTLAITDANGCVGTGVHNTSVVINSRPVVSSIGSTSPVCEGSNLNFSSTAGGALAPYGYAWSGPGAYTSTQQNPIIPAAATSATGTYTLIVTDANGCTNAAAATAVVVINPRPVLSSISNSGPVCAGTSLSFSSTASGGTGSLTYAWSGPIAYTATGASPVIASPVTGNTGIYTLTVTDGLACRASGTNTTTATVYTRPVLGAISNNGPVCAGSTLTLSSSATGGTAPLAYAWSGPNSFSNTNANTSVTGATTLASGIYTINITDAHGCVPTAVNTMTATVRPTPAIAAIGSNSAICSGSTLSLTSTVTGGTGSITYAWSGPAGFTATVANPSIPAATTAASGVYTLAVSDVNSCGTTSTTAVLVNPTPVFGSIGNNGPICAGTTLSLTSVVTGGTAPVSYIWNGPAAYSSTLANPSITGAAVTASGVYTFNATDVNGCTTTAHTMTATVYPAVTINSIGSSSPACAGYALSFSSTATGGTGTLSYAWSGPAGFTASVASPLIASPTTATSGTYTLSVSDVNSCGATATTAVTVHATPVLTSLSNNGPVCAGSTLALMSTVTGGTAPLAYSWSGPASFSSTLANPSIVGAAASATGVYTLSVTDANGCAPIATNTMAATVNAGPAAISGDGNVCEGATTTLTNAAGTGTWSSSNTSIATVNTGGVVSGLVMGMATISYILPSGCYGTLEVSVNPMPGAITGPTAICAGSTITLSNSLAGGTWSSSNTAVATAGSTSGVITGLAAGTAYITYTSDKGCAVATSVPVSNVIAAISGGTGTCTGLFLTLTDATTGGIWSSSNTAIVTVNSGGLVQALSGGSAFITYTVGACYRTQPMTISTAPPEITGNLQICIGNTTALSDPISGGSWLSSSSFIASANATSGVVTGVSAGTVNITYALSTTCRTSVVLTVDPSPVVTGPAIVCLGTTAAFSSPTAGGVWVSSSSSIASVDAGGNVTGVATGNASITYTIGTGCARIVTLNVAPLPAAISGASVICPGTTSIYTDATSGGTMWSSSDMSVATIGSASGMITGVSTGIVTITYTVSSGCISTKTITVNPLPDVISGAPAVCTGATTVLSSSPAGGVWSSGSTAIATVSSTGVVTGATTGAATISYTQGVGCSRTVVVTVSASPGSITGSTTICQGTTTTLANSTTGGTWISSDDAIANADLSTGAVTGNAAGNATMTYTAPNGCTRTAAVTVNSIAAITGTTSVCDGQTTALAHAISGGVWASSNTAVATVNSASGAVVTVGAGTSTITYTLTAGCKAFTVITANPTPATITGTTNVNIAATVTFANTVSGGVWSSSNTALATVDPSTGLITGVADGTPTITYTVGSCYRTKSIIVNPEPDAIVGSPTVCVGLSINMSNPQIGQSWISSDPSVATIGSASGVVTGLTPGTTVITFTALSGATALKTVTVNPQPGAITGSGPICVGASTTFANPDAGGVWISSNTPVATVGGTTGVVSGASPGMSVITYSLAGCIAIKGINVNPNPNTITGVATVCIGSTSTLADATTGGTWTSGTTTVATIGSTGIVSGIGTGTSLITYMISSTGCAQTREVTVNVMPAITGIMTACIGATTTLSNTATPGVWTSSTPAVGTIGGGTGILSGMSAGTTIVSYTFSPGCKAGTIVTVVPTANNITGPVYVCLNSTATVANTSPSGIWSSSNPTAAAIGSATGVISGLSAGAATITYTIPNGCFKTYGFTVKPLPLPIVGNAAVCVGSNSNFTDPSPTGVSWTSSTPAVGTIGFGSGVFGGVSAGITTITYLNNTGCSITTDVTVSALSSAGTITGPSTIGIAASTAVPVLYSNTATGGLWSSTTRATIGSASGLVRGVSAGTATLTYAATTGCKTTLVITVTSPRAAGGATLAGAGIQLYPNPTSGSFTLKTEGSGTLSVYTLEGKEAARYTIADGDNMLTLPKELAAGIYMCRYTGDDGESAVVRLVYQP